MDDRDFLAELYQLFAKTTDAETAYWMDEELVNVPGMFKIYAVSVDPATNGEHRKLVASYCRTEDSDFITALHGSFPDIYRRVLEAFDEADRLDEDRDRQERRIADLEIELRNAKAANTALKDQIDRYTEDLDRLDQDYMSAKSEVDYWKEQADGMA